MEPAPFLSLDDFLDLWDGKPLTDPQQGRVALMLQVAANWIAANVPGTPDPAAAQYVSFEVVANAINYSKYRGLSSFSRTTGHRMEAGTFESHPSSGLDFTDEHRQVLGIPLRAVGQGAFYLDDFALPSDAGLGTFDYDFINPTGMGTFDEEFDEMLSDGGVDNI